MGNSLLAVRGINHKYIVVERDKQLREIKKHIGELEKSEDEKAKYELVRFRREYDKLVEQKEREKQKKNF